MTIGVVCTPPILQFTLNDGQPAAGGSILTQVGGVNAATYADLGLTTPLPNPIPLNSRGEISDASGASKQLFLTPNTVYTFTLSDASGNTIWAAAYVDGIQVTLTQAAIGAALYPQTAAELAAGITPVNFYYPPGYVDRYATNSTPGTTDMSTAFNNAAKAAYMSGVSGPAGCKVRWGATAPYRLNNPVNFTGIRGVVFEDESGGNQSTGYTSIIVGHTGHGFDCSTSNELTFKNVVATNVPGTVPKTLFFCARNLAGSGSGIHRFDNCRTPSACTFNWIYYGYGSEENDFTGCEWYNAQPGGGVMSCNATNPALYTSSFVTIASGSQSNADHRLWACSLFSMGNSGAHNEICVQIENAQNLRVRDGLFACPSGLAYVQILGNTASNFLTFDSVRGEAVGNPLFGWYVSPSAGSVTHVAWTFNNCQCNSSAGALLNFLTTNGPSIQNLLMTACVATSGILLQCYNMSASHIESLQDSVVLGLTGGTVSSNVFIGGRNNVNLAASTITSPNIYLDNFLGAVGIDNDVFQSTAAACTGALTISVQWTVRLSPNGKQVILALPATLGTTTAAASFTYGVVLPVQYRPSSNLRQAVIIEDNGATPNQMGQVFINAATGSITVFKDIVGTANFTAGVTGGLPGLTEISWNL